MITTVTGDIAPAHLGATNYHEHLFQTSPLLPGDELDDESLSRDEAASLHASGFTAMIDATPVGLGRRPTALRRISEATGLRIVATTGRHREAHYAADHPVRAWSVDDAAGAFVRDLTVGMPDDVTGVATDVRAGVLKAGLEYWSIPVFARTTLEAIGIAHAQTGAAVMVHLEFCTAAHEVLDLLVALGVPSDRVILAHADRDPDPGLHASLAARGAYLGYDGMARPRTRSDAELLALTEAVTAAGHADRVLLGGDVARATHYLAYGGMPGLEYLGRRYLPRLRERIGAAAVELMTTVNPARVLAV